MLDITETHIPSEVILRGVDTTRSDDGSQTVAADTLKAAIGSLQSQEDFVVGAYTVADKHKYMMVLGLELLAQDVEAGCDMTDSCPAY